MCLVVLSGTIIFSPREASAHSGWQCWASAVTYDNGATTYKFNVCGYTKSGHGNELAAVVSNPALAYALYFSPASCGNVVVGLISSATDPQNGSCGTINGANQTWPSSGTWCSAGTQSDWTQKGDQSNSNLWKWSCNGSNGGTNASCSFTQQCGAGQVLSNGSCVSNTTCSNGATNYPTCTTNNSGVCLNGDNNPPTCTTAPTPTCSNGATDYSTCIKCPVGQCLDRHNVCNPGTGAVCSISTGNLVDSCGVTVGIGCASGSCDPTTNQCNPVASSTTPILTLTSAQPHIQSGGTCTLIWSIRGASSCSLNGPGANYTIPLVSGASSDSKSIANITSSSNYTLNCSNGTKTSSASAVCSVTPTIIEN